MLEYMRHGRLAAHINAPKVRFPGQGAGQMTWPGSRKEKEMTTKTSRTPRSSGTPEALPVLPLRDIVVFPHMIVPLFVGREKSIKALEEVMREDKRILLAAQRNPGDDDPAPDAIYTVGTVAQVLQLLKLPDGTVKVLVEGVERARVIDYVARADFYEATVEPIINDLGARQSFDQHLDGIVRQLQKLQHSRQRP